MSRNDPQGAKPSPEEDAAAKRIEEDMEAFSRFIHNTWERRYPFSEVLADWGIK